MDNKLYVVTYTEPCNKEPRTLVYSNKDEAYRIAEIINNMYHLDDHMVDEYKAEVVPTHAINHHMDIEHATFIPVMTELNADYHYSGLIGGERWDYWFGSAIYRSNHTYNGNSDLMYGRNRIDKLSSRIHDYNLLRFVLYPTVRWDSTDESIIEQAKIAIVELFNKSIPKHGYTSIEEMCNASNDEALSRGFEIVQDNGPNLVCFLDDYNWNGKS